MLFTGPTADPPASTISSSYAGITTKSNYRYGNESESLTAGVQAPRDMAPPSPSVRNCYMKKLPSSVRPLHVNGVRPVEPDDEEGVMARKISRR